MISPTRVLIESPFKAASPEGEARNVRYVRACMRDSLLRGEAPFASHALYTLEGVLKDGEPAERKLGMEAGWAYLEVCKVTAVYTDLGISDGMRAGIERAESPWTADRQARLPSAIVYRTLGADWDTFVSSTNFLLQEGRRLERARIIHWLRGATNDQGGRSGDWYVDQTIAKYLEEGHHLEGFKEP